MSGSATMCFDCLRHRIQSEISPHVVFLYGISDSPFPFGSTAVVQVCLFEAEESELSEDASAQNILVQLVDLPNRERSLWDIRLEKSAECIHSMYSSTKSQIGDELNGVISLEGMAVASQNDSPLFSNCRVGDLNSSSVNCSTHLSLLKIFDALSPLTYVSQCSYTTVKDLVHKYFSGSTEDNVILSLNAFTEGKLADEQSSIFLRLVGFPSFGVNSTTSCLRHPNIPPLIGIVNSSSYTLWLHPKSPYTLENILYYSPNALKSDWHIRFLIYQILSALIYMHNLKISHGNLRPSSILFSDSFWGWLSLSNMRIIRGRLNTEGQPSPSSSIGCCIDNCPCQTIHTDLKLSASMDWRSNFIKWWKGELSNYEYLLILNKLAGRRWGDHTFHTVMPWVIDFSVKPDENCDTGWRDLKKSKWRLAKGDEQLDFTYLTSEVPHHVSDECLSELAVCSYKARRLPLKILCSAVRSVYEPNEYPSNMQRLYQWTPDECIPEFYSDPQMFFSIHSEMCDLAVPSWSSSPEEFISLHRNALESDRVSRDIHHWIDITFGYKLSGEASILAKNVMLLASDPSIPKSTGRRQLFTNPHPMRQAVKPYSGSNGNREANVGLQNQLKESMMNSNSKDSLRTESGYLEKLEEAMSFCDVARYLDPIYSCDENFVKFPYVVPHKFYPELDCLEKQGENSLVPSDFGFGHLLEFFDCNDNSFTGFQKLLHWKHLSSSGSSTEDLAGDIFSMGCIIAELYLRKPLFDPISFSAYHENGLFPAVMQELPPSVAVVVEAAICRDWKRRLSAMCLLESPFFPPSVRAVYLFVAPLQHLSSPGYRLQYAAKLANGGALKALGTHATEMCASYTLPLIMSAFSDAETESALFLLKEFLKCLSFQAIEALLLPTIQKILQASEYSHLKVSILQESFIRDLWKHLGKHAYLEGFHPLVISNFYNAPSKVSASVASVVLIGSSEELGIPITVHQTVLPLMHYFGKGLSADGIDALVRIGGVLGENFIVRQLLPLLRNIVFSCIEASHMNKPEPVRSWIALALIDSFAFLDGLVSLLSPELILRELTQDQNCLYIKVLLQDHLDLPVIQASATALISVCQRIGSECTASYVLPLMKKVFDELSFTRPTNFEADSSCNRSGISQSMPDENFEIGNRLDLVFLLYPSFAHLIGIEKLRQCCSTWFLLERILNRHYSWQWKSMGESSKSTGGRRSAQSVHDYKISSSQNKPAKMPLNGVDWSTPQLKGVQAGLSAVDVSQEDELQQRFSFRPTTPSSFEQNEPWFWFPGPEARSDLPDFLGRGGSLKDESSWKIKASVLYSTRAHPGVLRSIADSHDEITTYTGGVGSGFKGSVQKWDLPRMNCISGYYGHDEVVNSICVLSVSGRIASSDGTIHIWNGQSGKRISAYAESSVNFTQYTSATAKVSTEQMSMLTPYSLSGGILSNVFNGSLYTCMHFLKSSYKLIAGMGNGSIRFIDVLQDQKLHLWKSDAAEYSFTSHVSAICSCGSEKLQGESVITSSSWIAIGLSSGYCRLLDARSGSVIACWRAHDGYITKLAAPEDHLLVSSSLDKTLRVWDLRRNMATQSNVFRGHEDGISSFSIWGPDVVSISRNKIALSTVSHALEQGAQQRISPRNLCSFDKGTRNLSVLSAISVLPFSRLFLVGTEDGCLKFVRGVLAVLHPILGE